MCISIKTKEGKIMVFEGDGKRTAGELLYNWSVKNKPEWWQAPKKKKKGKK